MKVAIQGIEGSFHNEAAHRLLPGQTFELVPCGNFAEVFRAIQNGQADLGISAIENSIHGSINAVYRLLDRHKLWIAGETTLHINQYLIGHAETALEQLNNPETEVLSQAPALAQCELWLDEHLPLAKRQETTDTADSVRYVVANQSEKFAAIAGKHAAELYGGTVLAGPINDDPHNYTRFVLLQKNHDTPDDANRTSIILTTDHAPGALYNALGVFARHGINLSKLDSHPIPTDKRHYAFYIDLEAGLQNQALTETFKQLRQDGHAVKLLGSYNAA